MILFFADEIAFSLRERCRCRRWLTAISEDAGREMGALNYIFTSDPALLEINRRFLKHDYYTDVITFDYCEGNVVSGDVFISIDTVRANAKEYGVPFTEELHRVMSHGLLHLLGYDDHSEQESVRMRAGEESALARWNEML